MGSSQSKGGSTNLNPINNGSSSQEGTIDGDNEANKAASTLSSWSTTKHNIRQKKTTTDGGSDSSSHSLNSGVARKRTTKLDPTQLTGVALIEHKCRKKKRAWSKCVSDHYEQKFLPGKALEPEEDCGTLFDVYRTCYMKGMLHERQRMGAPPPKEGTMLYEFMEDKGMFADLAAAEAQRK